MRAGPGPCRREPALILEVLFLAFALLLLYAGSNLARYGEAIARETAVSATWVGLFLVAAVTSVPELVTGVSSILVVRQPDLAAGDVLGSTLYNLALAAGIGLVARGRSTAPSDRRLYVVAAAYATLMLLGVIAGAVAGRLGFAAVWLGLPMVAIALLYFLATRHLFRIQAGKGGPRRGARSAARRRAFALYALFGALTVLAALALPVLADGIAARRGLHRAVVGTVILAGSTSLPELVVAGAAVRRGSAALALGGLFGSNLFNMLVLVVDDLFYAPGPLLGAIGPHHVATATAGILLTWAIVSGFPPGRPPRSPVLALALAAYAAFLALLSTGRLVWRAAGACHPARSDAGGRSAG